MIKKRMTKKRGDVFHVNQSIQGGTGLSIGEPASGTIGQDLNFKDNAGQNKQMRLSGIAIHKCDNPSTCSICHKIFLNSIETTKKIDKTKRKGDYFVPAPTW